MESRPKRRRTGGTARLSRQSALLLLRDILRWDELERSWRTVRVSWAGSGAVLQARGVLYRSDSSRRVICDEPVAQTQKSVAPSQWLHRQCPALMSASA